VSGSKPDRRHAGGDTVLTMIPEDNFSMIQPTLSRAFWIAPLRSQ
jgi:hypothetical protein